MTARSATSERGAVLIFVAIALFGLLAFATFVVDYGVLWAARGGAQNAADAGALAGAGSLAHGQTTAHAYDAALELTKRNAVFDAAATNPNITVTVPLACPIPFSATPPNMSCVKVDVQRQDVPTFFGKMLNIQTQGVKATATAIAGQGNSTQCIKPWVVADKWIDNSGTGLNTSGWDQMDQFDPGVDTYAAPGFKATGPGNDFGTQLVLKAGVTGTWSAGWTMEIDFGVSGSSAYKDALKGCPSFVPTVGLYDGTSPCSVASDAAPEKGCLSVKTGMSQGPTSQGVSTDTASQPPPSIVNQDPGAYFDTTTNKIAGGCMGAGTCQISPRVVPIAIFDTTAYINTNCSGTNCVARVVNIIGFFVEGMCDEVYPNGTQPAYCGTNAQAQKMVVGRLINYPAQSTGIAGAPGPASFITVVKLIR